MGTMLLGSVPTPPRKPRSWTRTQSATHNATATYTAGRTTRGIPAQKAIPIAARRTTTTRLMPHPWDESRRPNARKVDAKGPGWVVCDIWRTMVVSVPGLDPRTAPCQNPRPGQAWRTAMPTRNRPVPRSTSRPSLGLDHARSGRATRAPAAQ